MKYIYKIFALIIILFAISCNNSDKKVSLELMNLNYDSLLVDSIVNINQDFKVVKLKDWQIDEKATQNKEDMLFFNNKNNYGMLTTKVNSDGKLDSYIQETLATFKKVETVSESTYTFNGKIYHQYILQNEGYIILKAIIEIDETNYLDINFVIVENKYPEVSRMIETYLASIAILN